jgi:hypothetical protein
MIGGIFLRATRLYPKILNVLLVLTLTFSASGCFYLVFGGAAAAGGYAISRDTIQGEMDREFSQVWDSAVEVISIMGRIESQDHEKGEIISIVQGSRVTVDLIQITPATIRLKIKARRMGLPRIGLAQDIYLKVTSQIDK